MYKYIMGIVIGLLIFGCSSSTVSDGVYIEQQKHFGYLGTAMEDLGTGNYIVELSSSSNIATISSCKEVEGIDRIIDLIVEAWNNGMKCILWLDHWLWEIEEWETLERKLYLREDYLERMSILKTELVPYAESIHMFYVLDEPYWNGSRVGISSSDMLAMLEDVAVAIRGAFPEIEVGSCFASINENFVIPDGFTTVGFDFYFCPPQDIEQYKVDYLEYLDVFKSKTTHHKLFLVPGGFQFTHNPANHDDLIQVADFFYNVFLDEPLAETMIVFFISNSPRANRVN